MRGYFEWTGTPGNKRPHFLHSKDGGLFAAAGIYTARKVEDQWQLSASIITRPARDASGEIHDRMPVFMKEESVVVAGEQLGTAAANVQKYWVAPRSG